MKIARIVTRADGDLILGSNVNLLHPEVVYEITEVMGVLLIQPVGMSIFTQWGKDANSILLDGIHLLTVEEYKKAT